MPVEHPSHVVERLDAELKVFRRRAVALLAWVLVLVGIASLVVGWGMVGVAARWVFFAGILLGVVAVGSAHRGYQRASLGLIVVASTLFLWWTTIYVSDSDLTPVYMALLALILVIFLDSVRGRLAGAALLLAGAVAMRVHHDLVFDVATGRTVALVFDTVCIFVGAVVLTELHRRRRDRDHQSLRLALEENRALMVEAIAARDQAREANDAKGAFLARVSHELRTPLNAIIGYAELLDEEELVDADGVEDLDRHASGRNLLGLVDDLLDLTAMEVVPPSPSLHTEAVAPLFDEVAAEIAPLLHGTGLQVAVEVAEAVMDREALRQVLLELLGNAARFTEEGSIDVRACLEGQDLCVSVRDDGVGIEADKLPRIFEPFVQGVGVQYQRGGTGLGLALCHQRMRQMGGRIEVESQVGVGSTFTVVLPQR